MDKWTLKERILYSMDLFLTKRGSSIAIFSVITLSIVIIGGVIYHVANVGNDDPPLIENSLFKAWQFVADPSSHFSEENWKNKFIGVIFSIFFMNVVGLVITLLGFITWAMLTSFVLDYGICKSF